MAFVSSWSVLGGSRGGLDVSRCGTSGLACKGLCGRRSRRVVTSVLEGEMLPMEEKLMTIGSSGKHEEVSVAEVFQGKKVAVCAVPGPFTPTCNDSHLPSFIANYDAMKAKGVDQVVCIAVTDPYVNRSWIKSLGAEDKIMMLADGDASFTKAAGLAKDTGKFGGIRSSRYSMIVVDGKVVKLNRDSKGLETSSGDVLVTQLAEGVDPLEAFCSLNPEADECRTYED